MAEITIEEISSWYRSKGKLLSDYGIALTGITEHKMYKHSSFVDFDTPTKIARIIGWVSGEFDFQILDSNNAETLYLRHELVSEIGSHKLELAFSEFFEQLRQP